MSDVTPSLKVAIGGDEAAYDLKEILIGYIRELGYEVEDFGTFNDFLFTQSGHMFHRTITD